MDVLAVVNQKGGVGKTATTINVGAAFAEAGSRVLLVDWDPQGHLTRSLGLPDSAPPATLTGALLGQWSGELRELITPFGERLDVIATNQDAFLLEPQMYARTGREYLLGSLLDALEPAYDVCLIDCPPSLGALTDNALAATWRRRPAERRGRVLIPVQAEDSSIDALRLLFDQMRTIEAALGMTLETAGLVVNLYDARRGNVATSTLKALSEIDGLNVLTVIGDRKEMREAWRLHQPVVAHAPTSDPAGWYRELAKTLGAGEGGDAA
jgi:chromosome partitioning protein